jgi:hypothetical protein
MTPEPRLICFGNFTLDDVVLPTLVRIGRAELTWACTCGAICGEASSVIAML